MWYAEDEFSVTIGGNTFVNVPDILVYEGKSVFSIRRSERDGLLGIDFDIRDRDGVKVATVKKGNIYEGDESRYTVETEKDRYTLTEKESGRVICDIRKRPEAKGVELEVSVELYMEDGVPFKATPGGIDLQGRRAHVMMSGSTIRGFPKGIVVEKGAVRVGSR